MEKNDHVMVKDLGSKFGTYVGERAVVSSQNSSQEDRLNKNQACQLTIADRVRFGLLSSLFKLDRLQLVICTSSLSTDEAEKVKDYVSQLPGAKLVRGWTDEITHLIVSPVGTMTIKVANALGKCLPVITPTYLADLHNCLTSQQVLPDPANYLPLLKEVNVNDCSLAINPKRKRVFAHKRLLFATKEQLAKYKVAIQNAGGKAELYQEQTLVQDSDVMVATSIPKSSLSKAWLRALDQYEKEWELLPVQEMHIALAILHASCETYCNPSKKYRVLAGTPSTPRQTQFPLLASQSTHQNTQSATQKSSTSYYSKDDVPETMLHSKSITAASSSMTSSSLQFQDNDEQIFEKPKKVPQNKNVEKEISELFNFEDEEDEEAFSPPNAKRKRSEDFEMSTPAKKVDLKKTPPPPPSSTIVRPMEETPTWPSGNIMLPLDGATFTSTIVTPSPSNVTTSSKFAESNGFISKSKMRASESERSKFLEDVGGNPSELSRSLVVLERKPLLVRKPVENPADENNQATMKNVKKFRKQRVANSSMPIIRTTLSTASASTMDTSKRDMSPAPVEERATRRPPEDVENLWNFDGTQGM